MNNDNNPVVTFSNIPLDDQPAAVGFDALPPEAAEQLAPQPVTVVDVQFKKGGKVYYFDPKGLTVEQGDDVIIETAKGAEYAFCVGGNHDVPGELVVSPLRSVIRIATDADRETRRSFKAKEFQALATCQQKIAEHGLDMKLVSAEYSFDGSKILFYFTAEGRVDFRELVKDLASVFRTRIELRQIGVRDEAKLLGGLGICGRTFCCKQFLDDFRPVSIKMAKTQSLSLNPTKISGACGRLMCCLQYEQSSYESLMKTAPKTDSLVNTYDGPGVVTESNILKQTVKVRLMNEDATKTYAAEEVQVLRSGKGRRSDPPVDLTGIEPLPRPEAKPRDEEIAMFDESKLSNYTAGDAAAEAERAARAQRRRAKYEAAEAQSQAQAQSRSRNRSRNRGRSRSQSDHPGDQIKTRSQTERPGDQIKTKGQAAQAAGQSQSGQKKRSSKRRYYHGNKKPGGGTGQS